MKISIVLAAAFAAGLTTFAANAREEGARQASISPVKPGAAVAERVKDDRVEKTATEDAALAKRGLTAEEVFHAAKANEPETRYKSIIERYASLNGIPVQLAHAVITVESNYKPNSRGKAGEVGLMQIKPATAKMMGYSGSVTGLFDPETNIRYGMKYLGKAQRLGDGTTCGTILKYNAGHGAKRMNPVSRDYCKKVTRHILEAIGWALPARKYEHGV